MSTFKALNVESDDETDAEIDDTKEIQIEEALKLYQTALKLHSQGPSYFPEASTAYKALFASDLFKWPESQAEFHRADFDIGFTGSENDSFNEPQISLSDAAPSTLPQILHLSYKNHAEFLVDLTQQHIQQRLPSLPYRKESGLLELDPVVLSSAASALQNFAQALDKDDSDLGLWRRIARTTEVLNSARTTRFCLEAALDDEDDSFYTDFGSQNLEAAFASEQLTELLKTIEDDSSLLQVLSSSQGKPLSSAIKRFSDPYPFLQRFSPDSVFQARLLPSNPGYQILSIPSPSWTALGQALLQGLNAQRSGLVDGRPGSAVQIQVAQPGLAESGQSLAVSPSELKSVDSLDRAEEAEDRSVIVTRRDTDLEQNWDIKEDNEVLATVADVARNDDSQNVAVVQLSDATGSGEPADSVKPPETATAPTRKRSTDAAGLTESAEGGRVRSKRIKARESMGDSGTKTLQPTLANAAEVHKQFEEQCQLYVQADHWLFAVVGELLEKLDIQGLGSSQQLRDIFSSTQLESSKSSTASTKDGLEVAITDFRDILKDWNRGKKKNFLSGEDVKDHAASHSTSLASFLEHAKTGLAPASSKPTLAESSGVDALVRIVNSKRLFIEEVALLWVQSLLQPGGLSDLSSQHDAERSSYMQHHWSTDLKNTTTQIIVEFNEWLYEFYLHAITSVSEEYVPNMDAPSTSTLTHDQVNLIETVQTLFEIHVDVYSTATNPGSEVDTTTRTAQRDRLERWFQLAREATRLYADRYPFSAQDGQLIWRHLWAAVLYVTVCEDTSREHLALCMHDLNHVIASVNLTAIELPNNASMPQISAEAADRELSRLSTMDFFLSIFDDDQQDPVSVIETLEPLLEPQSSKRADIDALGLETSAQQAPPQSSPWKGPDNNKASVQEHMSKFLEDGNTSLRLTLWQRLREAYHAISYTPKVVSCYLRSIEIITEEFKSPTYTKINHNQRVLMLMQWLRALDDILVRLVKIMQHEDGPLDAIDDGHVRQSLSALADIARLLQTFTLHEDSVRLSQMSHTPAVPGTQNTQNNRHTTSSWTAVSLKFRDMQIRTWTLIYLLFKDSIAQNKDLFPTASDDRVDFLRSVHYAFSARGYCHACKKLFMRMMRDELRTCSAVEGYESDMAQILYDIYGLKCSANSADCQDHGSSPDSLNRQHALALLDFVVEQARKVNIKDLHRTELRLAVEKIHEALGKSKPDPVVARNKRTIIQYVKSSVIPVELYRCLKGLEYLSTTTVQNEQAAIAAKGWYFLMGQFAMARFRALKRTAPSPTEDLNVAIAFFIQDLEYDTEKWESWYRMAQAYDSKIEEHVLWSGEKLNGNRDEINEFQRCSIHCYMMSAATATRSIALTAETENKVLDMYTDFGMRMYASSREPFSMEAFNPCEPEKHYSGPEGMYTRQPFRPLHVYKAWQCASILFKRALSAKREAWINHYMLAKCLWKMYTARHTRPRDTSDTGKEGVLNAVIRAIHTLPKQKEGKQDPILEPHYKLVSIVHKLVGRDELTPRDACTVLQATPYARKSPPVDDIGGWKQCILGVLKALRTADKANWHHRMIARSAHVMYDEVSNVTAAHCARHELNQIFTKTMALQVWKPEHERPGRHFVYTSRYLRFFIQLLEQLNDHASMEALARRVRRRINEFLEHSELWCELCVAYIKLLRRHGQAPEGHEDIVFGCVTQEEFHKISDAVEKWCHDLSHETTVVESLRDALELKKLNNGLMKVTTIDDLIEDAYAVIWAQVAPTIVVSHFDAQPRSSPPPNAPPRSTPMALAHLMNSDGTSDQTKQTTPVAAAAHPEAAPKARMKFVTRSEIRRSADAAANRPAAAPGAAPSSARSAHILPHKRSSLSSVTVVIQTGANNPLTAAANAEENDDDESTLEPASSPRTVHASADESSILSEVDDEMVDADTDEERDIDARDEKDQSSSDAGGPVPVDSPPGDRPVEKSSDGDTKQDVDIMEVEKSEGGAADPAIWQD